MALAHGAAQAGWSKKATLYGVFIHADNLSGQSALFSYMVSARTLTQRGEREDMQRTLHRGLDLSSLLTTSKNTSAG